jgi:hypothetical protein
MYLILHHVARPPSTLTRMHGCLMFSRYSVSKDIWEVSEGYLINHGNNIFSYLQTSRYTFSTSECPPRRTRIESKPASPPRRRYRMTSMRKLNTQQSLDASVQKEQFVSEIKHSILSQDRISIDNALCLGLGSMEMAELEAGRKWLTPAQPVEEYTALDATRSPNPSTRARASVKGAKDWNINLYQLLVFETALACLCNISLVHCRCRPC